MILLKRRILVAAGATLASALPARKPRGEEALPDLSRLRTVAGETPPAIRMTLPDGATLGLADYAGQGVVLNLWATWCVPCVAEMPALERLAQALAEAKVVVLPLSSDRAGAPAVERFYQARGIKALPVLLDPGGVGTRALGARGIPTTLLIDGTGRERARLEGAADWSSAASVARVRALISPAAG